MRIQPPQDLRGVRTFNAIDADSNPCLELPVSQGMVEWKRASIAPLNDGKQAIAIVGVLPSLY